MDEEIRLANELKMQLNLIQVKFLRFPKMRKNLMTHERGGNN